MSEYYIIEREWTETLQGAELLLYAYIVTTCRNCDGVCQCSKANISHWTGVGARWLGRALESLQKRGLITIEEQAGKYNKYIAHPYTKSVPLHLKCTPTLKVQDTPTLKVYPHIINKEKLKKDRVFIKPTIDEIAAYCSERGNGITAAEFYDFYESKGWKVGSTPMKDWRACVRTWENRRKNDKQHGNNRRQADYSEAVNRAIIAGLCSQQ